MELDKAIKIFEEGMHKNICKHQEFAFCHDEDGAFYHARLAEEHAQMAEWLRELKRLRAGKWIPVSEKLPENAKHKGAFCPKYYVMTEFGQTEGWYNPDVGCWYVLLWFMDARFETWNISLERGDVPKLVKNVPVVAWMPLPEPYKAESEGRNDT
jgi:hypothetical protein